MLEGKKHRQRVRKNHEPPEHQVEIDLVEGPHGAEFQPASLRISAGTTCLWRNRSGQPQEVLPVDDGAPFKGGPLLAGGTRLVLARRPGALAFRLASNPTAQLTIMVTEDVILP